MKLSRLLYLFILTISWGCDISKNDFEPTSTFVKIYDDNRFEQEYYPLDVIQTADNGYLILSEKKDDQSLFTSVYVLKTDELGNVITQTEMVAPYSNPLNGWSKIGDMSRPRWKGIVVIPGTPYLIHDADKGVRLFEFRP